MRPEKVSRKTTNLGRLILLPLALLASNTFAQNPVPFIDQPVVPSAVAPGGPDFSLTVNGAGFVSGATINWNGTPLTTTFVSSSQLTATVPSANIATPSTASITVANPSTATASNAAFLTVASPLNAPTFISAPSPPVGKQAEWIVVGDFNGDGRLDLAVANFCGNDPKCGSNATVTMLLGNGDGTFTPAAGPPITVGSGPMALAVGDFNGDGTPDLAVANYRDDTVTILLGNGDGTFTPAAGSPVNVGNGPLALAAGDFNADGTLDLAVVNADGNNLTILLGNGDGTFRSEVSSPAGLDYPGSVVVGDFNGDDKLDLAVANSFADKVTILLGNGDGTFAPATGSPVLIAMPAGTLALADFNGDGKLDLAVASATSDINDVVVLLGNGHGGFSQAPGSPITIGGGPPAAIAVGDFTGDGKVDLAVASFSSNTVAILLGNGDATFAPADFSPPAPNDSVAITVGDFDGNGRLDLAVASNQQQAISVLLLLPSVRLSSSALSFSDQTLNTTSAAQSVQLINQSNVALNITNITASGDFGLDTAGTTCESSTPVAVGTSCTISVTFTPTALGSRTGTLTVTDDAYNSPQTATLSGNGVNPSAVLSPTSLSFGNQNVGTTTAAQPVTLTNSGLGTLSIASITASGDFAQTNTCGTSVAQGASCTINVTLTPTTGGTRTGAITITDNAANSPQTVTLTGTGVPPTVTLSATALTFGSYGIGITSPAQAVTVSNNGPGPVTLTKVTASGDFSETDNCVGTVAALASCTISVTFTPTVGGTRAGFVTITDNAVASPQTVTLSGTGTPPTATASPASLSFGNVAAGTTTTAQAVTLSNSGPGPLTISGISVGGTNASDFPQTNNCPGSLAASASCAINVTFTPTRNRVESATLTVSDNAASNPQTISLSGTGQAPVASLSPGSLDFPGQTVGATSPPQAMALANSGSLPLTVSNISVTSPFVVQSSTCPGPSSTLGAGASCTINLTFTASFAGTTFGSLYVSDNALGSGQQTVALTGEAALSFGDQSVGEVSTAQAVTVANGSTTKTVTITGVTATGDFAVTSNPCGALPPGGSCAPMVTFTPTAPGTRTGALAVKTFTGSALSVPLTGTGLGATATLSKTSIALGSQLVGTTSAATAITITNNGNQALNFTAIAASGDFSVAASGTTCAVGTAVAAGANCTISVTFKPTAGGARTGAVSIADNASGSPQTVALSGTGEDFTIGPASGSSTTQSVTAGQTATYNLAFSPAGGFTGTATLTCTGAPAGATCTPSPASLSLSGTTAADATVTVTTTAKTMDLPSQRWHNPVASPRAQRSPWGIPLAWLALLAILTFVAAVSHRRTPRLTLVAAVSHRRTPRVAQSLRCSNSAVLDRRPAEKPQSFWKTKLCATSLAVILLLVVIWAACGGGGAAPPPPAPGVSLSGTSLTFSNQNMGTTSTAQTVTLTNSGNAALSITGIALAGANSGDFAQTNTCGSSVSAAANCQIKAAFSPSATGTRTGSVTITDNATGSPQAVSLSGMGVPPATPAGSYALTVTASSSNGVSHSIALTLTVM